MSLAALAQGLERRDDRFVLRGASGWMQGRTMYGGASSFIAYAAARARFPDLPPLRAAQIGFVGPVGEHVEVDVTMLRSGRSVSHVDTVMTCEGALVHRATWLFGSARPDNGTVPAPQIRGLSLPEETDTLPAGLGAPAFIAKFDLCRAELPAGTPPATVRRWVRLKDRAGLDPVGELVGVGDTLPPGSILAMERQGPISSINWSFVLLGEAPQTRDGWWMLETSSNHMAGGFSSETLRLWNADGTEVMRGLQSVAVFG